MIAFEHLGKKYGDFTAVRDLDFAIEKGEVGESTPGSFLKRPKGGERL